MVKTLSSYWPTHWWVLWLFACFWTTNVVAQPGGGGGLVIKQLYVLRAKKLAPVDSSTVAMRLFALADTLVDAPVKWEMSVGQAPRRRYPGGHYHYLPPNVWLHGAFDLAATPWQRLYLAAGGQTMVVDFLGVYPKNPAGIIQQMDSLVFMPGYYRLRLGQFPPSLTPATASRGKARRALTYRRQTNLAFLRPENLPASYYLMRGVTAVRGNHPQPALVDLRHALHLGLPLLPRLVAYEYLAQGLGQTRQHDSAAAVISRAIAEICPTTLTGTEVLAGYYRQRITYLTHAARYDEALADYDTLVQLPYEGYPAFSYFNELDLFARSRFKATYFRGRPEYAEATQDIRARLDTVPAAAFGCSPAGRPQYLGYVLFALANAEYDGGQWPDAFRHWSQAVEMDHAMPAYHVLHFDSLLTRHPHEPELLLGQAVARIAVAEATDNTYTHEATRVGYEKALLELNEAERNGMMTYRLLYHRARVLKQLNRFSEALAQTNAAIAKNPSYPAAYALRHGIRAALGQAPPYVPHPTPAQAAAYQNDPDQQHFRQLCQEWRPARY